MKGYRPNRSGGPWTSFFVAVLFLLVFPLFPLGAELLFTGQITMASLMLMTATYATSLSMSSQHVGRWALGLTVGLMFSTLFGWCMGQAASGMGAAVRLQPGPTAHPGWFWFSVAGHPEHLCPARVRTLPSARGRRRSVSRVPGR